MYSFIISRTTAHAIHLVTALIERIELNDLRGFTSSQCLADVAHRIMTLEAMGRLGWPVSRLAARLNTHHVEIPKLSLYQQATPKVAQLGVQVVPLRESFVLDATRISHQFELLTGDVLIVASRPRRATRWPSCARTSVLRSLQSFLSSQALRSGIALETGSPPRW
jgi:hypothetical protein